VFQCFSMPTKTLASHQRQSIPPVLKSRRVVTWSVPAGVHGLLGDALTGGLVWLLGVEHPGDALAIVLRRAMSIDAEDEK
jgi:hypothetical protein